MRERAQLFLRFYTANKLDKNMKFIVASEPDEEHVGASIYLYEGGVLVSRCFKEIIKYSFGSHSPTHSVKTILLLGERESGKTSLIDAMINYILGVEWEDTFRYKLTEEETNSSEAESPLVIVYELNYQEGFKIPFSVTIVDTPRFEDIAQNKHIPEYIRCYKFSHQITDLLSSPKGVTQIDALCLVVQASIVQLTSEQECQFSSFLDTFGKDITENVRVLVTFADEQLPLVLEAITQSELPCPKDVNGQPVHFKFNTSTSSQCERRDIKIKDFYLKICLCC
uniref:SNTX thioredoxin-like domain-containing protein n=1 Tax=Callorhinchus milii TaxID=7868 RepID=A0A4W3HC75_CALMI